MRRHAGTSQRLIARMNRLVNDLLDITSIEAGKLDLVVEQVEAANILRDTLEAFDLIAVAKRVALDCDAPAASLRARIDEGRIQQVLANLVGMRSSSPRREAESRSGAERKEARFVSRSVTPESEFPKTRSRECSSASVRSARTAADSDSVSISPSASWRRTADGCGQRAARVGSTFHFTVPAELNRFEGRPEPDEPTGSVKVPPPSVTSAATEKNPASFVGGTGIEPGGRRTETLDAAPTCRSSAELRSLSCSCWFR